jgi:methylmalonyl-CoA/ethylmalonyl-CoA epimerase
LALLFRAGGGGPLPEINGHGRLPDRRATKKAAVARRDDIRTPEAATVYLLATSCNTFGTQDAMSSRNQNVDIGSFVESVDHIAIAVRDLDESVRYFERFFGCTVSEWRVTEGARTGMRSAVMSLGPLTIVLMQGMQPESQVSRYIDAYGPGVHHVALRVASTEQAGSVLAERGVQFSTDIIRSSKTVQLFTKRDPATGMMLEIIERGQFSGFTDEGVQQLFEQMEENELI